MESDKLLLFSADNTDVLVRSNVVVITIIFGFAVWFEGQLDRKRVLSLGHNLCKTSLNVPVRFLDVCVTKQGAIRGMHGRIFIRSLLATVLFLRVFIANLLLLELAKLSLLGFRPWIDLAIILEEILKLVHKLFPVKVRHGCL